MLVQNVDFSPFLYSLNVRHCSPKPKVCVCKSIEHCTFVLFFWKSIHIFEVVDIIFLCIYLQPIKPYLNIVRPFTLAVWAALSILTVSSALILGWINHQSWKLFYGISRLKIALATAGNVLRTILGQSEFVFWIEQWVE